MGRGTKSHQLPVMVGLRTSSHPTVFRVSHLEPEEQFFSGLCTGFPVSWGGPDRHHGLQPNTPVDRPSRDAGL